MKSDDTEVAEAVFGCWRGLLDKAANSEPVVLCKQQKDLWSGFRPGMAPVREVRRSAKASLGTVPGPPDDFKDLLARAGFSQFLLCVLSEATLAEAGVLLCVWFGRAEAVSAMHLNSREPVRKLGFSLLEKWDSLQPTETERLEARKEYAYELRPFLAHLRELKVESEVAEARIKEQSTVDTCSTATGRQ